MEENAGISLAVSAYALAIGIIFPHVAIAAEQDIIQQQRQKAIEAQLQPPVPDVRLSTPAVSSSRVSFPAENPCFDIQHITLNGLNDFPGWLPLQRLANQGQGHCLGVKGINLLMSMLLNRMIDSGYVTSRVLAPPQDLTEGTLTLQLVAGKISHIGRTDSSDRYVTLATALPSREGKLYDLRDTEQGLENLQRLPTVQADMALIPGSAPGESVMAVQWNQSKMWRLAASLDDSGSTSTGRYQGGLTLYLDNPLSLSDMLYVSASHDLQFGNDKGTKNVTGSYSVPFGYWLASITTSDYSYHQTVAGAFTDYEYSGKSKSLNANLSRVLHRNGSQKTTLSYDVITRETRNFINDTEIDVQRRQTSAWRLGLQHRHYIGSATLDAGVSYQRGTRWFGAQPAPEEYWGEATALAKIVQLNAQLAVPFSLLSQRFSFNTQYLRQMSNTPLTPQDQFALGNRWSVRGFDGQRTLNADEGWTLRNDIGWATPLPSQELYLALDYGEVSGRNSGQDYLIGKHLAGGAVGLRGYALRTSYDLFAGIPLSKPAGYQTSSLTLGFNLNWHY
ncbi:ShlB/FhaC/HecB family hemolysin secretion/activation protein [Pantoea sp. MQR6]|uniref:ShlB/FhaC/HecB family hemolysin secretion/activation protein n=1 Tax=Pantoea sp. MQR6 TaxID=2907307 RepID=UPI001FA9A458|nr:ShlB/FhaC/HecB family hemolysin secretion/activation protein [Pantoea sp. MQR6]